jgi:hypothetical protein
MISRSFTMMLALFTGIFVFGGLFPNSSFGQTSDQPHSAHWYNQDSSSGRFSVRLNQPNGLESVVAVTREKGVNTTILGIGTDMTYDRKILECLPGASCFPPSIILGIDKDMDGKYEADDLQWQWSLVDETPGGDPRLLHGDTFLQCESQLPIGTPDPNWVSVDAYATYACYHPDAAGVIYVNYAPLSLYQFPGVGAVGGILPTSRVLAIKVLAGGAGSWIDYKALVDRVTLGQNGLPMVRIDEPNNSRSHFEVATRH